MGTNWPRGEKKSTSYLMCEENLLLDAEDGFLGCFVSGLLGRSMPQFNG